MTKGLLAIIVGSGMAWFWSKLHDPQIAIAVAVWIMCVRFVWVEDGGKLK